MIKLNIKNLELPVFDIIQAAPFCIPLDKDHNLYFKIPSVNEYFTFEAKYLTLIHKYFVLFSKVNFLESKDFKSLELKESFLKELKKVLQNESFKVDFRKIIIKYFTADFKIKKIMDIADPFQMGYLMLFIHKIVENVKSFFFTGGGKGKPGDLGDFFYFFERNFHKNRTEILEMPITYAMLLQNKYNAETNNIIKNRKGRK
jgi:hypothetical protein